MYKQIYQVVRLPKVWSLIVVLLTCRLAFSTADNITSLKLTEKGFPREKLAILGTLMFPFGIFFSFFSLYPMSLYEHHWWARSYVP